MPSNRRYSAEVRERAVRLCFDHRGELASAWAAMRSIGPGRPAAREVIWQQAAGDSREREKSWALRSVRLVNVYRLIVGDRGRIVVPAAIRRACGMRDGDDVIVVVGDDGVLTLQTAEALARKVAAAQAALGDGDGVGELRDWRATTDAERADRLERPVFDEALSAARGRIALEKLGLA